MKNLGASKNTLLEIYKLFVRQALEIAAPVWNSSLSKSNIRQLEKIQCLATNIIIGNSRRLSYEERLRELALVSLETRRWNITAKFAKSLSENPDFEYLFPRRPAGCNKYKKQSKVHTNKGSHEKIPDESRPNLHLIIK